MTHLPLSSSAIRAALDARFPSYDADTLLQGAFGLLKQGYAPQTVEAHLCIAGLDGRTAAGIVRQVLLPRLEGDRRG